jgi:hypothetical protein
MSTTTSKTTTHLSTTYMSKLISIMDKADYPQGEDSYSININWTIDDLNGFLTIEKHRNYANKDCFNVDFTITGFRFYEYLEEPDQEFSSEKHAFTASELPNAINVVLNRKFHNGKWLDPKDLIEQQTLHHALYEATGKTMEKCYVCMDFSYGHKTPRCKHDICHKCFIKSINWHKHCDDEREFKCGVCRLRTTATLTDPDCESYHEHDDEDA